MRIGSLFSGIGGFDLAARWMGWETAWFSEIDPYASAVLAKHWPDVPNLGDITKIDWSTVERPGMLCGGFPCQDVSSAGKRVGIGGERSGLWREYVRAIRELRPRYVVVENTPGLLDRGMGVVLGDLAELGYDAEWRVLSAGALGAPHLRERVWIISYPQHQPDATERGERATLSCEGAGRRDDPRGGNGTPQRQESLRSAGTIRTGFSDTPGISSGQLRGLECPAQGATDWDLLRPWLQPEPRRLAHGLPAELDQIHRAIGNAVVPVCALVPFQAIREAEDAMTRAPAPEGTQT
jgi:DNA (cytosine-5)-methyltransferase 1